MEKFVGWCRRSWVEAKPPLTTSLAAAYLWHVYHETRSYSTVALVQAALKWYHSFLPSPHLNPFVSALCGSILESAKRNKASIKRKVPVSSEMVKDIVEKYAGPTAKLKDLRIACLCTLGFTGFLRYEQYCACGSTDYGGSLENTNSSGKEWHLQGRKSCVYK